MRIRTNHRWLSRAGVALCTLALAVLPAMLAGAASHHAGHQGIEASSTPPPSLLPIEACDNPETEQRLEPVGLAEGAMTSAPPRCEPVADACAILPRFLEFHSTSSLRGPPRA